MPDKKTIRDVDVSGKKVLLRVDFNVPFKPGTVEISNTNRITSSLPTIRYLLDHGAAIIICSHLGRPRGKAVRSLTLGPIGEKLSQFLDVPVGFCPSIDFCEIDLFTRDLKSGQVVLLENLRFHVGEEENEAGFSLLLSGLADIYVNDAFGAAHRAHASTQGVTRYLPSVAGLLLEEEIRSLRHVMLDPPRPFTAVLGGAKISDKINVVKRLDSMADTVLIGGGMAATFLKAQGFNVGLSLVEENFLLEAETLVSNRDTRISGLMLPSDVVVSKSFHSDVEHRICEVSDIKYDEMLLDIGPQTVKKYVNVLEKSASVFWNGPMGVFEWEQYSLGTKLVAEAISAGGRTSVIGGGSTVEAISKFGLEGRMTHISTGGGASLEFLEGKNLPGIESLTDFDNPECI